MPSSIISQVIPAGLKNMSGTRRWGKKKPPAGWEYIQPTIDALSAEIREVNSTPSGGKNKLEANWPIHQINNQRSRYIYDMYAVHKKISRELYMYCVKQKLVDAALVAKWKKPGYEKLCSVFVIDRRNFPFGTTSICRVPRKTLKNKIIFEANTGCRGCASGSGRSNIFGNKYGQRLARIQIARETKLEALYESEETTVLSDQKEQSSSSNSEGTSLLAGQGSPPGPWASMDSSDDDEEAEDNDDEEEDNEDNEEHEGFSSSEGNKRRAEERDEETSAKRFKS
jgi:bud site selection protein 31